ncbi:MAG: hypothetical protein FWC43_06205 [Planctomycetaceae bacterium]|nr:hypothetical protein [Planctomycetaceae bacterium]MCL2304920.1 hypothetical protein [Planctomycetaceae bacterium]
MEFLIALVPLAIYFALIGIIPFYRRPIVRSGGSDLFWLWLGVSGLVMVGPVKLLFPINALILWDKFAFALLGALYILVGVLVAGIRQPQIIVYNIRKEDFQSFLDELMEKNEVQVVGNCVQISKIDVQFSYEMQPFWQCLVLQATSRNQSLGGWLQMERVLHEKFAACKTPLTVKALILPLVSVLLAAWGCYLLKW